MRHFHLNRNHSFAPTLNLDKLWSLVGQENRERAAKEADKIPVIDIVQFVSIFLFSTILIRTYDDIPNGRSKRNCTLLFFMLITFATDFFNYLQACLYLFRHQINILFLSF